MCLYIPAVHAGSSVTGWRPDCVRYAFTVSSHVAFGGATGTGFETATAERVSTGRAATGAGALRQPATSTAPSAARRHRVMVVDRRARSDPRCRVAKAGA